VKSFFTTTAQKQTLEVTDDSQNRLMTLSLWMRIKNWLNALSLAQQYMLASLAVLLIGLGVLGWWVGRAISDGLVHRAAAETALYVDSFILNLTQELGYTDKISSSNVAKLENLLATSPLGKEVVGIKIWGPGGRVLYGVNAGQVFEVKDDLARSWNGEITADLTDLSDQENNGQRGRWSRLLEIYTPIRLEGSDRIIAVAEFYQTVDGLEREIGAAQSQSWLVVGAVMFGAYLLLTGMVRRGSDTISRQQRELGQQVSQLNTLLVQNEELHERVQRAATRTTALNERYLRRVSAELHDGPAQDMSLVLLQLGKKTDPTQTTLRLEAIQNTLKHALEEMRSIASGLLLPELEQLTLPETLERVVETHRWRTETQVLFKAQNLPDYVPLPLKITAFRLVQEALNNAFRHATGADQRVEARLSHNQIVLEISDAGPGFTRSNVLSDNHLGLLGMRERVESLGGLFEVHSVIGQGTKIIARLPIQQSIIEDWNHHD
jgi:signal transduction histidine kinase